MELKLLREVMPKEIIYPIDILNYLMRANCFPSAIIAYKILLTIHVTVAYVERSFSKLKLLRSYLRTTMIQERLNGLAMIAFENDILEKIKFDDLVDDFASKKLGEWRYLDEKIRLVYSFYILTIFCHKLF